MHNLRAKLSIAFVLVALIGVGAVALVANRVTAREFTLYVSLGGKMRAQRIAAEAAYYYQQTGSWQDVEAALQQTTAGRAPGHGHGHGAEVVNTPQERILIVAPDGRVIVDTEHELIGRLFEDDYENKGAPIVIGTTTIGTLLIATPDLERSGLEQQFLQAVNKAVLVATLLAATVSIIAAVLLAQQLVAPLKQLTTATEAMAAGDLSQRVDILTRDEIGELGLAFNKMAGDLQTAEAQRQQMTADIAHELRNPLSVIRGNLEALLDGVYPIDEEHLAPIYEETLLLQRLVEDLRLLSLTDAGQLGLILTHVDIQTLISGIAESARAIAGEREIALQVRLPQAPLTLQGDLDRLRQVIGNLVNNALFYTPPGGAITISAEQTARRVQISVSDTGPGIAPQDLPHIFDRFYRADSARDRASGGSGLGLAITRALVQAHHGTIDVHSAPGQGATFTISLPQTPPHPTT